MSLVVSANSNTQFAIHPATVTAARCTRIIDLGTVDDEFQGKKRKSHKIAFCFESAELMPEDQGEYAGKPFLVSQQFTASLSEKANLRKFLEAWRGRKFTPAELDGFDLANVLGKACMLNIVHTDPNDKGTVYANIGSVTPLPKGMTCPEAVGDQVFFSLGINDDGESAFDQEQFDKLTDYYKGKVALSDEFKALVAEGAAKPFVAKDKDAKDAPAPAPSKSPKPAPKPAPKSTNGFEDMDDDIPF